MQKLFFLFANVILSLFLDIIPFPPTIPVVLVVPAVVANESNVKNAHEFLIKYLYLFNIYYSQCRNDMKCEERCDMPIICHSSVRWGRGLIEWENEWNGLKKTKKKKKSVPQKVKIKRLKSQWERNEWRNEPSISLNGHLSS